MQGFSIFKHDVSMRTFRVDICACRPPIAGIRLLGEGQPYQ